MSRSEPNPKGAWKAFVSRHAGSRFLECEAIYSLTPELLEAMVKRIPDLFTEAEISFEKDLAQTASFGFFNGRAFGYCSTPGTADNDLRERDRRNSEEIDAMLKEEYARAGIMDEQVHRRNRVHGRSRTTIIDRKSAFVGWLVTNSEFRSEVDALRERWGATVKRIGRFPMHPRWRFFDFEPMTKTPPSFEKDFIAFYGRWQLDQLLTWDWPVPMEADLLGNLLENRQIFTEAGFGVFVPWFYLRDRKLDVQELLAAALSTDVPRHMRSWLREGRGRRDDRKHERMAYLYRFRVLALEGRYGSRLHRKNDLLDDIFAEAMHVKKDQVRKLRSALKRAIGPAE